VNGSGRVGLQDLKRRRATSVERNVPYHSVPYHTLDIVLGRDGGVGGREKAGGQ
jgi:hypothetical protein